MARKKTPESPSGSSGEEDSALFRQAVADAAPLRASNRHHVRKRPPRPQARMREADDVAVMEQLLDPPPEWLDDFDMESGEELSYRYNGVQISTLRKLRRGQYRLQGELDLHGCTVETARPALTEFLQHCEQASWRCVRIIHGKGRGSGNRGPVLKARVDYWLRQRSEVMAFCSARPEDGGTGAVYVLLRGPRQ